LQSNLIQGCRGGQRGIRANPEYFRVLTEELDSRTTPTFVFGDQIIVGFDQDEYQRLPGPVRTKRDRQAFRGSV
jgi:hypothetical protein